MGSVWRVVALGLALQAPVPAPAIGQDTGAAAEAAAEAPEPIDPLTGDASFGLTVTEGNSETLSLNFAGRIEYALPQHKWSLSTDMVRTRSGGELSANKGSVGLRYDYEPGRRFFFNSRVRASYNRPAGLERRVAPGVGAGYDFLRTDDARLSLNAGMNWIDERFADDSRENALYFDLEQQFKLRVNSTTDLEQLLSYSPRPENLSDYLVRASLALTTKIWKLLGLKTQIIDEYDSTPFVDPETGESRASNDFTFITGLNVSF